MKIQSNCLIIFLIALPNLIYAQFYLGASSSANIGVNGRSNGASVSLVPAIN